MSKRITPETALKQAGKHYLELSGWFTFHFIQNFGAYAGLSDNAAVKTINGVNIVLWLEYKSKVGRQSDKQKKFEKDIKDAGGHYILVRDVEDIENYVVEKFGEKSLLNYN